MPGQAAEDPLKARLVMLEDIDAIRALNRACARQVSAGATGAMGLTGQPGVALHDFGERDKIWVSPDRQTAVCVMHCSVELETAIGPSCPLVEMAREQGGGFVRRSESGVFEQSYIRRERMWTLQRSTFSPA